MVVSQRASSDIRRATLFATGSRVAGAGMLLAMHTLAGQYVGPAGYGVFSFALAVGNLLGMVAPLGWATALVRLSGEYLTQDRWDLLRGALRRAAQLTLGVSVLMSAIVLGATRTPWLSGELRLGLGFSAVLVPLAALTLVLRRALQGFEATTRSVIIGEVATPLLAVAAFLALGLSGPSAALTIYALAAAATVLTGSLWLRRATPAALRAAVPRYRTRSWWLLALPLVLGEVGQLLLLRTDIVMLGALKGMEATGIYSAASRLSQLCVFVFGAVNVVVAPRLARSFHGRRRAEFAGTVRRGAWYSVLGALPLFVGILVWPDWLLSLFGPDFRAGAPMLRVLGLAQLVNAWVGPAAFALLVAGGERGFAASTASVAVLNLVANALLIPPFGAMGAAVATAASVVLLKAWQFLLYRRILSDSA